MKNIRKLLNKILEVLCFSTFLIMVILVCWQVITRYLLKNPSSWSEELVSFLFAWMTLLGASIVVGERKHMNVPILYEKLGGNKEKLLIIFSELIIIVISGFIMVNGGIAITKLSLATLTASLKIPLGIFYIVIPLCGVLNIIYSILNIYDICLEREE